MSNNDLARKIKELRTKHGLTLEQVGDAVGVGKSTVRKWETGLIENMRRDKVAKLAEALHTTPSYLMGWPEPSTDVTIIDYEEAQEYLRIILTELEYKMLRTYQAADDRARQDALALLEQHPRRK